MLKLNKSKKILFLSCTSHMWVNSTDVKHFIIYSQKVLLDSAHLTMGSPYNLSHPQDCFWSKGSINKHEILMQPQNHLGLQTDPKLELWAFPVRTWLSGDPHQPSEFRRRIRQTYASNDIIMSGKIFLKIWSAMQK